MKKNYKKIIILVILLINCSGLYKICSAKLTNNLTLNNIQNKDRLEEIKKKGVLTVLISDDPPFSFIDPNTNTPTGINIDIINEIAKTLGINKVEFKVVPFPDSLNTLNNDDSIDIAANAFAITDERKKLVNFTDPLYKESEGVVLPKISIINFKEDLKNAVIGVQKGTIYVPLAENWKKEGTIKDFVIFETIPELLSSIRLKKVDAGIMDSIIAEYIFFTQDPYLRIMYPYTPTNTANIGMAVRKSDTNLLNEINKKITFLKEDKILDKIFKKYGINTKNIIYNME